MSISSGINEFVFSYENILRHINKNRAGSSGAGYVEGLFHYSRKIPGFPHKVVMFRAGPCYADMIGFLKRIASKVLRRNLSRKNNYGR